jgi:hypothetical protein
MHSLFASLTRKLARAQSEQGARGDSGNINAHTRRSLRAALRSMQPFISRGQSIKRRKRKERVPQLIMC